MKINFFKKAQDLSRVRNKLIKNLSYDHGYSILRSSKSLKANKYLYELASDYDEIGFMSQELGEELDSLFLNDEYSIGIHRTGHNIMSNEMIETIFRDGLINNGHVMTGAVNGTQDISRTVSTFKDFTLLNGQLKSAFHYKDSQGCIIVKIPKSYIGEGNGEIKPIYYKKNGVTYLLPEFIYGYIPVSNDGVLKEIIRNPRYKDIHNLDNSNLLYETNAIEKSKQSGFNLETKKCSIDFCYNILVKAYKETLEKYGKFQADGALKKLIYENDVQSFTGIENRSSLKKFVCYGDILKIMCFGIDNINQKDIDSIIDSFSNSVNIGNNIDKKK